MNIRRPRGLLATAFFGLIVLAIGALLLGAVTEYRPVLFVGLVAAVLVVPVGLAVYLKVPRTSRTR